MTMFISTLKGSRWMMFGFTMRSDRLLYYWVIPRSIEFEVAHVLIAGPPRATLDPQGSVRGSIHTVLDRSVSCGPFRPHNLHDGAPEACVHGNSGGQTSRFVAACLNNQALFIWKPEMSFQSQLWTQKNSKPQFLTLKSFFGPLRV